MTRESKILQTAAEWLRYYHPTCTQDMLCRAFECGARWADNNPQWFDPKEEVPQKVHEGDMWGQVLISKDGFVREATYAFKLKKFEVVIGNESRYIEPDYWMYMPHAPKVNRKWAFAGIVERNKQINPHEVKGATPYEVRGTFPHEVQVKQFNFFYKYGD